MTVCFFNNYKGNKNARHQPGDGSHPAIALLPLQSIHCKIPKYPSSFQAFIKNPCFRGEIKNQFLRDCLA
jgi:hypothetical protein